jgi:hypothetical protein
MCRDYENVLGEAQVQPAQLPPSSAVMCGRKYFSFDLTIPKGTELCTHRHPSLASRAGSSLHRNKVFRIRIVRSSVVCRTRLPSSSFLQRFGSQRPTTYHHPLIAVCKSTPAILGLAAQVRHGTDTSFLAQHLDGESSPQASRGIAGQRTTSRLPSKRRALLPQQISPSDNIQRSTVLYSASSPSNKVEAPRATQN